MKSNQFFTKNKKLIYWFLFFVLLVIGISLFITFNKEIKLQDITNFEECAAAGNPVTQSYPRQCSANGQGFVEEIKGNPVPVGPVVDDK